MGFRLGLLEDENLTRLTLASALKSLGHQVLVESGVAGEFLRQAQRQRLDAVILDLHLGAGPTGLDIAKQLLAANNELGLVFLTSFEDPRLLDPKHDGLPSGSVYLVKGEITDIALLDGAIVSAIDKIGRQPAFSSIQILSDTQVETLKLVAQGLSNSEIAKRRFITEKSVEVTIARIAKALGLMSKPDLNQRVHMAKVYFRSRGIDLD